MRLVPARASSPKINGRKVILMKGSRTVRVARGGSRARFFFRRPFMDGRVKVEGKSGEISLREVERNQIRGAVGHFCAVAEASSAIRYSI